MQDTGFVHHHCGIAPTAAGLPLAPLSRSANLEQALYAAGDAVAQVRAGRSLGDALQRVEAGPGLGAAVQDLAYGTLRNLGLLDALLAELLRKERNGRAKPMPAVAGL